MNDLDWIKEVRLWWQNSKAEQSTRNLAEAFRDLRQNVEPLNKELKELNENTKKSKNLLAKLAKLQEGLDKQNTRLLVLTIIMAIFALAQIIIGLIQIGLIKM